MKKTFKFKEHDLIIEGSEGDLLDLAQKLKGSEGTLGDIVYQIEYFFDVDGVRTQI